jgi:hypothetical protein
VRIIVAKVVFLQPAWDHAAQMSILRTVRSDRMQASGQMQLHRMCISPIALLLPEFIILCELKDTQIDGPPNNYAISCAAGDVIADNDGVLVLSPE